MTVDAGSPAMSAIDVPALLDDFESLEGQLDTGATVAVVGPPFGGRDLVLERLGQRLDTDTLTLGPDAAPERITDAVDDGPVIVDNCQQLYRRRIGGFDALDSVLDALARADGTVLTGWNSYAWSYLDAVRDVGDDFETVELTTLAGPELGEIIRSQVERLPSFRIDADEESVVQFEGDSTNLSVPALDWGAIRSRLGPSKDPEVVFFDRLASVAGGNPGVAIAIWRALPDNEVKPSDIEVPSIELDRVAAFLLRVILTQETVRRGPLTEYVGDRLDRLLASLCGEGIVSDDGERVSIEATAVPAAVNVTETNRIL